MLRDERAGHHYLSDAKGWTSWDFAIITALQVIKDYTNQHGILAWDAEADRDVDIIAVRKKDRFEAAKTAVTSRKSHKPIPGEYYVPKLKLMEGSEWPTMRDWLMKDLESE